MKVLGFDLTYRCNLQCRYCGAKTSRSELTRELTAEQACQVLEVGRKAGCKILVLAGGEPFIRKDLIDIVEYASRLKYSVSILTNGLLLTDEIAQRLSKILYLDFVRVSIEGCERSTVEYFRGTGSFEEAVRAVRTLRKHKVTVGLGVTVYPENISAISDIVRFSIKEGMDFARFIPAVSVGAARNIRISKFLYEQLISQLLAVIQQNNNQIYFEDKTTEAVYSKLAFCDMSIQCPAGRNYFYINPSGQMMPCQFIPENDHMPTCQAVQTPKEFYAMKERMDQFSFCIQQKLQGKCSVCVARNKCRGGCVAEKLVRNQSELEEQPICINEIFEGAWSKIDDAGKSLVARWISSSAEDPPAPKCVRQLPIWTIRFRHDYQ